MPGAFCNDSTVFTSFRVFCSSFSSSICLVSICSLCRCNDLSDSSVCIARFFRIFFLIFLKSAIFLLSLPLNNKIYMISMYFSTFSSVYSFLVLLLYSF